MHRDDFDFVFEVLQGFFGSLYGVFDDRYQRDDFVVAVEEICEVLTFVAEVGHVDAKQQVIVISHTGLPFSREICLVLSRAPSRPRRCVVVITGHIFRTAWGWWLMLDRCRHQCE